MKNVDASESLPRRSATARAAWSEETTPLRSSRTANELQHATRWRPSIGGKLKLGLDHGTRYLTETNVPWASPSPSDGFIALGLLNHPRARDWPKGRLFQLDTSYRDRGVRHGGNLVQSKMKSGAKSEISIEIREIVKSQ